MSAHRTTPLQQRTSSEVETVALGSALGRGLRAGDLVALHGDLGAGKTCMVRGIAAGLGADPERVHSPTFVLHHVHHGGRVTLHHVDLYRLGPAADVAPLDLEELLADGVVCIEWAEYAGEVDADPVVDVDIEAPAHDRRVVTLGPGAPNRAVDAFLSWRTET